MALLKKEIDLEYRPVPPDELVIDKGAQVIATDGHIGRVDEFKINPATGRIKRVRAIPLPKNSRFNNWARPTPRHTSINSDTPVK
jgi:hypothetical protein